MGPPPPRSLPCLPAGITMPLARVTNPGVKPVWRRVRARGVAAHPAAALPLGAASHPGRPPPRGGAARRGRGRPGEGARRPRLRREPRGRGAAPGGGEAARCGAVRCPGCSPSPAPGLPAPVSTAALTAVPGRGDGGCPGRCVVLPPECALG